MNTIVSSLENVTKITNEVHINKKYIFKLFLQLTRLTLSHFFLFNHIQFTALNSVHINTSLVYDCFTVPQSKIVDMRNKLQKKQYVFFGIANNFPHKIIVIDEIKKKT